MTTGSGAQEESLGRRTTLCQHLLWESYPILDNEALYSKGVVVFRDTEQRGFAPLPKPFSVDVITCPGIRHPKLVDEHLSQVDLDRLRVKIELIFQMAHANGARTLVAGALGCGAWRNPPADVAQVFKEVLDRYAGMLDTVVVAILPPDPTMFFSKGVGTTNNFSVFRDVLLSQRQAT